MSSSQASLSGAAASAVGLAALGVVAIDVGWQVIRHGTVMAHEGAHAIYGAKLTQLTHLPRLLWFLLWLAATVGAVAVGGKMLVMPA